jgi:hypothetical protein
VPRFELAAFDAPSAVEIGSEFVIEAEIKNTGTAVGDFSTVLYRRNATGSNQDREFLKTVSLSNVEQGETETVSITNSEPLVGPSVYSVAPFDEEKTIDFTPAKRTYGETFVPPNQYTITVDNVTSADTLVIDNYTEEKVTPEAGNKFILVYVTARNESDSLRTPAQINEFQLVTERGEYEARNPDSVLSGLQSPVSGEYYRDKYSLNPGIVVEGWLTFEVPEGTSISDTQVQWKRTYKDTEYAVIAYWETLN